MFVIVRHGNTFAAGERPRRVGWRTDLPLTAMGRAQAEALGIHLAAHGIRFSRALCSPLRRTRETARGVLASQPDAPTIEHADWLREIDHGPDENQPEDAVLARIGADALAAWDSSAVAPPGWETDAETRIACWRDLLLAQADPVGATLVVTSNGAARFALLSDPALTAASSALASLKLPTGGYGIIHRDEDGALSVQTWGVWP